VTSRFHEAVAALQGRGRFGIRLGLGRVRALLHALGDPQVDLPGALIGGTNGKGSVQAMVAAIWQAGGRRVGQTPSPHLVSYRERVLVDGHPIAPADFADLVDEVLRAEARVSGRLGHATEFELLTAAAFSWFRRSGVDLAAVEVGLGGRLDATNAWDGGIAAITNVELDHTDRLGTTLEAIAREKAAIIKPVDRALTGATGAGLEVIRRRVRGLGIGLREVTPLPVSTMDRSGLELAHPRLGRIRLGLLGRHQAANAAVALAVVEEADAAGMARIDDDAIRAGLRDVRWPGRLELVQLPSGGDALLDGAHNVAGAEALVAALDELQPSLSAGRPTVLFALMGDKDAAGMIERLSSSVALAGASIITTRVAMPRAMAAADLAAAWREQVDRLGLDVIELRSVEPVHAALQEALEQVRANGGPLVVAGSLYLVGEVRGLLVDDPDLRDPPDRP
jgi:dihydrofolate synthase/folylpolyglutamate synthase